MRKIRFIGIILVIIMMFGILSGCNNAPANGKNDNPAIGKNNVSDLIKEPEDGTLASVNGTIIKKEDVDKILPVLRYVYQKNPDDEDWDNFYNYAVEYVASGMMYDLILKEYNLSIDESQLDENLNKIKNVTNNPDEFYEDIAKYDVTEDMVKEFLKYDLAYTAIFEYVTKDVEATDEQIQKYFEDNKEALTNVTTRDFYQIGYEKKEDAQKDLDRILNGEATFEDILEEQDSDENGFMATVAKGELIDPFEDIVWSMKDGAVYTGVLESTRGFHIVMVNNFVENHTYELDEIKDTLKEQVTSQNAADAMSKVINDSMIKYQVSIYTSSND